MGRTLFAAAAVAALLSGCMTAATTDATAGLQMPADPTPEDRNAYVAMAASSDMYEIQSGQLALSRAQSAAVRNFGGALVDHHNETTQQLAAAAQAAGAPMPGAMMPLHAAMLARLQAQSGADFDGAFRAQQVMAHEMALALHRNYAQDGDAPALRTTAGAAVPIIQQHLVQARALPR